MTRSLHDLTLPTDSLALCVAGSRDLRSPLIKPLLLHYVQPIFDRVGVVVVGDARGVDRTIMLWARAVGIPYVVYEADWESEGNKAGILRNKRMVEAFDQLTCHKQGLIIRYHDSSGSKDTLSRLKACGIPVWDVSLPRPLQVDDGTA